MEHANPDDTRIGWIGTGVMGASMCGHLLDAGYAVTVTTRTPAKAEALMARGADRVTTPGEVAERSDVVFVMVGFPSDVREVVFGDAGIVEHARPGTIVVDMTTSEPTLAVEIARVAEARGVHALDAPVSGGDVGARAGELSIMVGGDPAALDAVTPCLQHLGTTIVHHGGPGTGQHAKMVNQTLIAGTMVSMCEALLYAHRAGLDLDAVLRSVGAGAAGSRSLTNLAPRILAGDLEPGFYVDHFVKDMGIALDESRRMGLTLPGLALAERLYREAQAQGLGRKGTQALMLAVAALSDVEWPVGERQSES